MLYFFKLASRRKFPPEPREGFYEIVEKRRGPHSLKSKKQKHSAGQNRGHQTNARGETNQPFEQDTKRRVGQHIGTGRTPLMKK